MVIIGLLLATQTGSHASRHAALGLMEVPWIQSYDAFFSATSSLREQRTCELADAEGQVAAGRGRQQPPRRLPRQQRRQPLVSLHRLRK